MTFRTFILFILIQYNVAELTQAQKESINFMFSIQWRKDFNQKLHDYILTF